jgi:hypothetical protein
MAQATPQAPAKEAAKTPEQIHLENCQNLFNQVFDTNKKYMFQLVATNMEREIPVHEVVNNRSVPLPNKKFKPAQNIVYTSQIVWPKGLKDPWSDKERNPGRYIIRYYDGCTTLFVDQQTQDRVAVEQFMKQTRERRFLEGKWGCYGDETMLLLYMHMCSWNQDSLFKTRTSSTVFVPVDRMKIATAESARLDLTEKALQMAKDASEKKMMIHASYLGVPMIDWDSDNPLTPEEIRAEYRKESLRNPSKFIESYGDKTIEIKYYISKSLETGLIDVKFNPNKAVWASSKNVICDISGLKSHDAIADKLFEFSQLEEGTEFLLQLQAVHK